MIDETQPVELEDAVDPFELLDRQPPSMVQRVACHVEKRLNPTQNALPRRVMGFSFTNGFGEFP